MNTNLMPCQIVGCDRIGDIKVSGNQNSVQVCAAHALEMVELQEKRDEARER